MQEILTHIHGLSSKRAAVRKKAIKGLRKHLTREKGHLARLALHYVAHHDPSYCVRNLARQAFYLEGTNPENHIWERTYGF
ncbi:MAG: hypothetical protein ABII71_06430 [Candidatus Micrarchaeota archaeon]